MEILKIVSVLGILGLVALAVAAMVRSERRRVAARKQSALRLGFSEVREPETQLLERICRLHQKTGDQTIEIANVYQQSGPDYELYLLDVRDHSGDSSDLVLDGGLAVVSSRLHLPRFTLCPKIVQPGRIAALANVVLERLARRAGTEVGFPTCPEFEARYFVVGPDEAGIRDLFSDRVLSRLSETQHWMIEGEGEFFTFDRFEFEARRARTEPAASRHAQERVDAALEALEILARD